MTGFQEERNPAFTYYEGSRLSQSLGEMSTEQAVAHARAVKALLQKAPAINISGAMCSIMPDGRLELAYGGTHVIYVDPQDLELLQELCGNAIQARENYDVNRITDSPVTPAPTVAQSGAVVGANHVPGVGSATAYGARPKGKYASLDPLIKAWEDNYNRHVKATQAAQNANRRFNW